MPGGFGQRRGTTDPRSPPHEPDVGAERFPDLRVELAPRTNLEPDLGDPLPEGGDDPVLFGELALQGGGAGGQFPHADIVADEH